MARQIPPANQSSNFDVNAWFTKWHEERTRYRSWLLVTVDEPLRANDGVSVYVFPHLDARDVLECYLDPRYCNKGYEVARCLFGEQLTEYTESRLTTILSIIRKIQGLDFQQGFAFLIQLFIFRLDLLRAEAGKESILFGPTYAQFDIKTAEGRDHLLSFENQPLWELTALFEFWDLFGGRHASGFYKSPNGELGLPNYLSIPPIWLSVGKLKELYGDKAEPCKIPLLIEPVYKPLTESLLSFYRENHQAGVPLNVSFSAPNREGQVASEVKQNAFRKDGDFWTLAYEGHTLRLKDAKGLHYIASLLHYPHRVFHVMELVSALAKREDGRTVKVYRQMSEAQLGEHDLSVSTLGDAGPVLDNRARRELKRRSDDLRECLEAGDFETPEQAADMRQEMHMIDAQLRSAIGLGGKERKGADPNERARKAVSKAISRSLETIRHHSPALWQHLHNALRIGYSCSYVPDRPVDWVT